MRFLCLHGIGTSSQILKTQTAAFRYELADQHTYRFVQGVVPWPMVPGLESLSDPSAPHYAYYDIGATAVSSLITALDQLEAYIAAYGPFDAVLGFSQGAGLAAMLMVRQHYLSPTGPSPFKCAVFFSPVSVYDPVAYLERGEERVLSGTIDGKYAISIPTAVVYGMHDARRAECEGLVKVCEPRLREVFVHKGEHEIPGIRLREELVEAVKLARRVVYKAELLSRCT